MQHGEQVNGRISNHYRVLSLLVVVYIEIHHKGCNVNKVFLPTLGS